MQQVQEIQVLSLCQEDPLEYEMATHCSILPWKIPWVEELGGLQSIESQRVRHSRGTEHTRNRSQSEILAFWTLNPNFCATEEALVPGTLHSGGVGDPLNMPRSHLCGRNGGLVSEHFPGIGFEVRVLQHVLS